MSANLSMLDMTENEYDKIYESNPELFYNISNWFYFANDKKVSPRAGRVFYGHYHGNCYDLDHPRSRSGAAVLLCKSNEVNLPNLRTKCAGAKDGLVWFELDDEQKTKAYYGIVKDTAGAWGPKNAEYPVVVIPDNPQTMEWPYSLEGNTIFDKASKEEGTLPNAVATGAIEKLIPANIKQELGIAQEQESGINFDDLAKVAEGDADALRKLIKVSGGSVENANKLVFETLMTELGADPKTNKIVREISLEDAEKARDVEGKLYAKNEADKITWFSNYEAALVLDKKTQADKIQTETVSQLVKQKPAERS
ncbi:MAG: hypothetical protein FWE53_01985 [Firmicutes bacterium]|nr:hypothetical protein [Bacillota bacterium]